MLIYEKSRQGRGSSLLPACDVPDHPLPEKDLRAEAPGLPQVSEVDLSRHYTELAHKAHGVNDGFYPLGSCTMKYNPRINEKTAALPGFTGVHPLQPESTVQGCLQVLKETGEALSAITGMEAFTFQPAAGAHGEFTGLLLIMAYHQANGQTQRTKIIVPDSAHGTNPASAVMAGMSVINVDSDESGCVDVAKLRELCESEEGQEIAGLMLTNPNTAGLFDPNILEITRIIHDCGGQVYYDGANLNAVMGIARPADMGFDCVHLNLHKTFSTPHGGGGPGAGPVGCRAHLAPFLPGKTVEEKDGVLTLAKPAQSLGEMKDFYGNFLVAVKALTYIKTLGAEGILSASQNAVLNANYMMAKLRDLYDIAFDTKVCMHEFVMDLSRLLKETGVSAMDIAKGLLDHGIHPPTMYFPLTVHEALMVEPTETESRETLDWAIGVLRDLHQLAHTDPEALHQAPVTTPVRRLDEVGAARHPVLRYTREEA
ncbi:MAG: aminomethyl-transferring glycine dehydrogenase subunit GcvPB [Firmicutes bacterium]|nr:aminomethyl-transferring glycine dehydrogenase subunit GcvPB [Bacillota bacterium]